MKLSLFCSGHMLLLLAILAAASANCVENYAFWKENTLPEQVVGELCGIDSDLVLDHRSGRTEFYLYGKQYLATSANFYSPLTNKDDTSLEDFINSTFTLECYTEKTSLFDEFCGQFPMEYGSQPQMQLLECALLLAEFNEGMHDVRACADSVEPQGDDSAHVMYIEAVNEGLNLLDNPEIAQAHKKEKPGIVVAATFVVVIVLLALLAICVYWNPIQLLDR